MRKRLLALLAVILFAAVPTGCSTPMEGPPDAGEDALPDPDRRGEDADGLDGEDAGSPAPPEPPEAPAAAAQPAPPAAPALVDWSCPEGWVAAPLLDEVQGCQPPALPASCPAGSFPVVGESTCQPLGTPCPPGDFAADLPASPAPIHVRPGPSGGDGSANAPYGSIAEALAVAPAGAVVALARGQYTETVVLDRGLTLWGACSAETVIVAPSLDEDVATVQVTASAAVSLRNLAVGGDRRGIQVTSGAGPLALQGVRLEGNLRQAVLMATGNLGGTFNDVLIDGTRVRPTGGLNGQGVAINGPGTVTLQRVTVRSSHTAGVQLSSGTGARLSASQLLVQGTASDSTAARGEGLLVAAGAQAEVERALLEGNASGGVGIAADGDTRATAAVQLTDVVVRDTLADASGYGPGLYALASGQVTLTRVLVESSTGAGLFLGDAGTSYDLQVSLQDVAVRDTRANADGVGPGIDLRGGVRLEGQRVLVRDSRGAGIFVQGMPGDAPIPTELTLTDLQVQDTESFATGGLGGWGLAAGIATRVSVSRALLRGNRVAAVLGGSPDGPGAVPTLELVDVTLEETRSQESDGTEGSGLSVVGPAEVTVRRLASRGHPFTGLALTDGASIDAEDLTVQDVQPQSPDQLGWGVALSQGAPSILSRVLIERCQQYGLVVVGADDGDPVAATLSDVTVRGTREPASGGTAGIYAQGPVQLQLSRALVEASPLAGVLFIGSDAPPQPVVLEDLVVRGTTAAASQLDAAGLQIIDTGRVTLDRALFEDNVGGGVVAGATSASGGGVPAELVATDVEVKGSRPDPVTGLHGSGITLQPAVDPATFFPLGAPRLTLTRARLTDNTAVGLQLIYTDATLADLEIAGTRVSSDQGADGDGIAALISIGSLQRARISGSARAGIAVFGAQLTVSDTALECNQIQLDQEAYGEVQGALEAVAPNRCGCGSETEVCRALSSALMPPQGPEIRGGPPSTP